MVMLRTDLPASLGVLRAPVQQMRQWLRRKRRLRPLSHQIHIHAVNLLHVSTFQTATKGWYEAIIILVVCHCVSPTLWLTLDSKFVDTCTFQFVWFCTFSSSSRVNIQTEINLISLDLNIVFVCIHSLINISKHQTENIRDLGHQWR